MASKASLDALPNIVFGTGFTVAEDTPSAGTDTVSITAYTYQAYDANMIAWPSTISATEVGYLNGLTEALSTSLSGKQATLVSGTNIKTVNNTSLLGSGNITITGGTAPTVQAEDPTSASATGWYAATGSGDIFYKSDDGLFTIAGSYVADPVTYAATLTITDASATGDTFTLNSVAYDAADSPVSVTNLPTAAEQITYTGSNTAACTGDVTGTGPWTINDSPATIGCTITTSTVTDNFSSWSGGNWTQMPTFSTLDGGADVTSSSGVAIASAYTTWASALYTGTSFANDQFAQVTMTGTVSTQSTGPLVRMDLNGNGYGAWCTTTTSCRIAKITAGSATTLGSAITTATNTGATLKLEASGDTMTLYLDGTSIATRTDSTYSSGSPGIRVYSNNATQIGLDDFSAGDL